MRGRCERRGTIGALAAVGALGPLVLHVWRGAAFVLPLPASLPRGIGARETAAAQPSLAPSRTGLASRHRRARRTPRPQSLTDSPVVPTVVHTPLWTLKATQMLIFAANACVVRYLTVYYNELGLSRPQMSMLLGILPVASFWGQLFWAKVVDRVGEYKPVLLGISLAGVAVVLSYLLPGVQGSLAVLAAVTGIHGFLAAPSGPLVDALCLEVLEQQEGNTDGYGDQRLWSAVGWGGMALVAGRLVDAFGTSSMFLSYAAIVGLNIAILMKWLPASAGARRNKIIASVSPGDDRPAVGLMDTLKKFDVLWLLTNLVVYGGLMALVENFLNVYLVQDFIGTPVVLIGMATLIMCAFEIPVFKYADRLHKRFGLINCLCMAELVLALRCVLYAILPRSQPWLVLLVEPLHGFTFAAMWCATVEYARKLAVPGTEATLQALVNGLFYQISAAAGSLLWGLVVQRPPRGLGFTKCFLLDAVFIVGWLVIFRAGQRLSQRRAVPTHGH